jgi:transmembrane sensor
MRIDREGRGALAHELEQWLAGDSRRAGALLQAEAAWSILDRARLAPPRWDRPTPVTSRRRLISIAVGGAVAAAAAVGGVALLSPGQTFVTTTGEIRRIPLRDGSTAAINSGSRLDVRFDDHVRRVRLTDGEVWFRVARDENRPFLVEAGPVRIEAVGTAFSVRHRDDGVDVRVTEGLVEVWVDGLAGQAIRVPAGVSTFVSTGVTFKKTTKRDPAGIERSLAWRTGWIDLAGETLMEAAEELNRYNTRKLYIDGDALGQERLYGTFRLDDPEGFAASAALSLDADMTTDADSIRLRRAED